MNIQTNFTFLFAAVVAIKEEGEHKKNNEPRSDGRTVVSWLRKKKKTQQKYPEMG